jgi:hypothetical protein
MATVTSASQLCNHGLVRLNATDGLTGATTVAVWVDGRGQERVFGVLSCRVLLQQKIVLADSFAACTISLAVVHFFC